MNKSIFPVFSGPESKFPYIIRSAGHSGSQENINRPNGYPHYHILISKSGSGMLNIADKILELSKDRGFFCYPHIPHEYHAVIEPWETLWLTFDGHGVSSLFDEAGIGQYEYIATQADKKLSAMTENIIRSLEPENSGKNYYSSALMYEFLLEFIHNISHSSNRSERFDPGRLKCVFEYIDKHYCLPISLDDLSSLLGITQRHFCRLFKQTTTRTPFEYILQKRIQKSKEMLCQERDLNISEIAGKAGFFSTSYFCRTFKRIEKMTPSQFRVIY